MIIIICLIVENYQLGIYFGRLSVPSAVAYCDQPLLSLVPAKRSSQKREKEVTNTQLSAIHIFTSLVNFYGDFYKCFKITTKYLANFPPVPIHFGNN